MDVGIFMRSKVQLGLWIGSPLALMALLYFTVTSYAHKTESRLRESTELVTLMPAMESRLESARALLHRFALPSPAGTTEIAELVRKRVAEAGQATHFSIESLSAVRNAGADAQTPACTVTVNASGGGRLEELIHFLNQTQGGEHLVVVESAMVRSSQLVTDTMYNADFVLKYYVLGP